MGTTYSEFMTTGANVIADIRTAILVSSDWAQPNAAGLPNLLKATTTRGVPLIVKLDENPADINRLRFGVYRDHDGTTALDKADKNLYFHRNGGTFSTLPIHCRISAGKEHLYIEVEGPKAGQTGADGSNGSYRSEFFLSDLVPYFPTEDPNPVVVTGALHNGGAYDGNYFDSAVYTFSPTQSYRQSKLASLQKVGTGGEINRLGKDGNLYLGPFVVCEDEGGMRGRLNKFFYAGRNWQDSDEAPLVTQNQVVTYSGGSYKIVAPYRSNGDGNWVMAGPFGFDFNRDSLTQHARSSLIAIPYA